MDSAAVSAPPPNPNPEVHVAINPDPEVHIAQVATAPPKHQSNQLNHPPYAEMIITAIKALNEKKGSSRKAIAKFIDSTYTNLPISHSALLTHHLKRLKKHGIVLMVKHSYQLPKSTLSSSPKRGRGRPPKSSKPKSKPIITSSTVSSNGPRGRGRPPKVSKPKPIAGPLSPKRGRGRPRKLISSNVEVGVVVAKPRGRPRKDPLVSAAPVPLGDILVPTIVVTRGRPRGRPPKVSGGPPKPKRVSTGRPVGRPRKVPVIVPVVE